MDSDSFHLWSIFQQIDFNKSRAETFLQKLIFHFLEQILVNIEQRWTKSTGASYCKEERYSWKINRNGNLGISKGLMTSSFNLEDDKRNCSYNFPLVIISWKELLARTSIHKHHGIWAFMTFWKLFLCHQCLNISKWPRNSHPFRNHSKRVKIFWNSQNILQFKKWD